MKRRPITQEQAIWFYIGALACDTLRKVQGQPSALREAPTILVDTPERTAKYWTEHIGVASNPLWKPDVESMYVLVLNTRRRIQTHFLVSMGTLDTIMVHAREVFAPAIMEKASALILMHNHPSGDPTPSEGDIRVTRDLIRAGQLLKIEVLDHVIMGLPSSPRTLPDSQLRGYVSLRELNYFYT